MPTLESVTISLREYAGKSLDEESKELIIDNNPQDISHLLPEDQEA